MTTTMSPARLAPWVLIALAAAVLDSASYGQAAAPSGGSAQSNARNAKVPLFEPDPLWSQALPNNWATGAVGGVAVDSHDNVWVFQRPASIPEGEKRRVAESAAGRVLHPRAAGARVRAGRQVPTGVGRPGRRLRVVHHRARHLHRRQGQRVAQRQREGRQPDPEVHAHRQVPHADRPRGQEHGQQRPRESRRSGRPVRATRRPTSCSSRTATSTIA